MCSGIGAPEQAAPEVEWVWHAEIEPFPCAVMAERHPQSVNLGDITAPDFIERAQAYGPLDVLVAGTPCQAFSVAGLRQSLADARGNLTLRFVDAVHAIRPRYAVWENVPGVLSTHDNAFGCLLAGLVGANEAIEIDDPRRRRTGKDGGYFAWPSVGVADGPFGAVAWRVLDAQYFSLAQRRERVFLVFRLGGAGTHPAQVLFEFDRMRRDSPPRREARQGVTGSIAARTRGGGRLGTDFDCDGGLVPSVSMCLNGGAMNRIDAESETLIALPVLEVGARTGASTTDPRAGSGIGENGDPMFTLQAGKQHGVLSFHGSQDPCVSEHVTHPVGRNQGQETCIAYNLRGREGGAMPEPTDVASLRSASGGSSRTYVGVRRLMLVECERLQGMADGYTAIDYNGKPAKDGPRYKAIGNSMAVPVLSWILRRINCQQDRP